MPRTYRLTRADFARIARTKGKRVHGSYFSLLVAPLPDAASPKFACVVSKKISPKAVVRNAIERKARESARPLLRTQKSGVAFVLYPKREITTASAAEVTKDIKELFSHATG